MQRKLTVILVAAALGGWLPATAAAEDKAASGAVIDAPAPNYADSMARLQEGAQRLREAIQQMAQHPPGEARNAALAQAHKALFDAQQAMIQLPPEIYEKERTDTLPNYTVAMERLQQAAQKFRESVQSMAQEPAGGRRDAALVEARSAIFETQQAMIELPLHMRSQLGAQIEPRGDAKTQSLSTLASTTATASALGSTAATTLGFGQVDCNGDGRISRLEWQMAYGKP